MSLFSYENQDFMFSNSNSIECTKCSEQKQKYIRCSCCNEVVTLTDIIKHINKDKDIIKLVRLGETLCIKIHVKDIFNISKYFYSNNSTTLAVNFDYKINYIESKTNDGKIIKSIRNIEFIQILDSFKEVNIDIKYLLMNSTINNDAEVLINANSLNVLLPTSN
jgi:hypothetical protein